MPVSFLSPAQRDKLVDNTGSRARRVTTITRNQPTEVGPDAPRWH